MYNEELKTKFIGDYTHSKHTADFCRATFNICDKYESMWGADLCTKSGEEMQPLIDELAELRLNSQWMYFAILKSYIQWCAVTGVPGAKGSLFNVNVAGLSEVRRKTVANPLHLQRYLNEIFVPESEKTVDNIYRCFYWMAYGGMEEEDIFKVKTSDVDFDSMTIRYADSEFPLYREALPAFKNSVYLTQFVYNHPNYTKTAYVDRAKGDTIMRGARGLLSANATRAILSRKSRHKMDAGETNLKLSYYRIWLSGLFYRMYERERAGSPVDFSAVVDELVAGKEYKLEKCRHTVAGKKRHLVKEYKNDYIRWKLAFQL